MLHPTFSILLAISAFAGTAHAGYTQTSVDGDAARVLYDAALNAGGKPQHDLGEDGHVVLGGSACQRTYFRLTAYACSLRPAPGAGVLAIAGDADSASGQLFEALEAASTSVDDLSLGVRQRIRLKHLDCVAFAVTGGYHCVVDQSVPDAPAASGYSVLLHSLGSDKLGAFHYLATVYAPDGTAIYGDVACRGATSLTASCRTRTVAVEAVHDGPSSLFLLLPSGERVRAPLQCRAIKLGLGCSTVP